jgi:hypothetical protein
MQVTDARYNQRGELVLLVDRIPSLETLRFRKLRVDDPVGLPHGRGYLYVAEQDGYVDFFFQLDPDHGWYGQGYDGREFPIRLEDGTAETLVGPWSVSTDLVNRYLPELAAGEVLLIDDRRRFEDGMATAAGAITARLWRETADRLQPTRPLAWLRYRYEQVQEHLSSTRPTPGDGNIGDSSALQRWVTGNVALFAEEDLLLRDIAARTAEIAAGTQQRPDIVAGLAEICPALGEGDRTPSGSLLAKAAVYYESYGAPGQTVAEVLQVAVAPYTTRSWELASITNDLDMIVEATADREEELHALRDRDLPDDNDASVPMDRHPSYQEYVANGVFAPYGRGTQGPASSLDDHYIGPFGDDWGDGEPAYDIGPSGTDEEHYEELDQYRLWLVARGLRALEASGQKAIPPGSSMVDVDRRLAPEFGYWLLDRQDSAIRAAAALQDPELAGRLFNTPNTQHVLTISDSDLEQLGRDTISLALLALVRASSQAAEPWLAGDVGPMLTARRSPVVPAALAEQARTASTAALQAWVEQAQSPHPPWREGWDVDLARDSVESAEKWAVEERLVLKGLRRELGQMGPWWRPGRWWPGHRQHRADLQARIAERAQEVDRLTAAVPEAQAGLDRAVQLQQAERAAWDAGHGAVLDRGVAAVHELQRREDELLDSYLRDPPEQLLEAIGPPPADPDGGQTWREQARQVERGRAVTGRRDPELAGDAEPGREFEEGRWESVPAGDEPEVEAESDSVSAWRHWHEPRRDSHGEIDRQHEPEIDRDGLEPDLDV